MYFMHKNKRHIFTNRLILTLTLLLIFVAEPALADTRVFYDDFESGNTNLWAEDHDRCQVRTASFDGGPGPHAGTYMVSCNSNGVVPYNDSAAYESLSSGVHPYDRELFIRAWLRIDGNDFDRASDRGSPKKFLRIFHWTGENSTYNDIFDTANRGDSLTNEGVAGGESFNTYWGTAGDNTNSDTANWHKIEYYFNLNTGTIRVWHDGMMVRNDSGLPLGNAPWLPVNLASNWSDSHDATNHVYFDDFEIFSDETGGTPVTGQLSDASVQVAGSDVIAPASPTGLMVD